MANLEQLSRATLQFIWQSQSAGQTSANPASTTVTLPGGQSDHAYSRDHERKTGSRNSQRNPS